MLEVGRLLAEQGSLERAHAALERALKCVPEHLAAREAMADVLTRQDLTLQAIGIYSDLTEFYAREGEASAVIRIAQKVLAIQPDHLATLLTLARAYSQDGQVDKQLLTQTRLVQLYAQGQSYTRASDLCEEILAQHEDYTPALEQLVAIAEATRHATQSVKYLWKLSQVHARAGRREEEQGILEQILAKDPLYMQAWFRHLELLMQWATPRVLAASVGQFVERCQAAARLDDAVEVLEDLRQTSTPKPEIFAGLAKLYHAKEDNESLKAALRTQAELLGKLLRDDEALEVWGELAQLQPEDLSIPRTRIEIMMRNDMKAEACEEYRRLASVLVLRGRYEEAQVSLLEVLAQNPRDAAARDDLISIFIQTRDFERAADQIEEAAGRMLEEGRLREAVEIFERIFEFDPRRAETYHKIIAIRQRMGDLDGALQTYGRLLDCLEDKAEVASFEQAALEAINLAPDSFAIRTRLAEFYARQGRRQEAESVLLTLAVRQIEKEEFDNAEGTLARLLEINPDSVPARAHRAQLMARRGQTNEALTEFISLTGSLATARIGGTGPEMVGAFRSGNYEGFPLLKDYTFDTFVVGERNNFAHATAMAVSRAPAKNYNPLFLYSDVGLGKTHLCHAIAHYILERHPQLRLLYTAAEDFVAELIDAIQSNQIAQFRNRHKLTDVLIVDDVQFLSGKERAQEEFFHVFNAIFQAGKQIVLTSDRPPKDIAHLEKRLKSRFGAGIIVDIQPPDLETRVAILRHELKTRGKEGALDDPVLLYVAEQVDSNIRELKGALNQVLARHEYSGKKMDLESTREVLERNITGA